jgi:hypothetical protein
MAVPIRVATSGDSALFSASRAMSGNEMVSTV